MIDNLKLRIALEGKHLEFEGCKKVQSKSKYVKIVEVPSPLQKGKSLRMEVDYYSANDRTVIDLMGSWRKWMLGENTTRDLKYDDLKICIAMISEKLGIEEERILNGKFLRIELGYNIRFKENVEGLINGFVFYKGFEPIYEYGRESVKFVGSAYSVGFYDKFLEIMNSFERKQKSEERELKSKGVYPEKRKSKVELAEKLKRKNFSLRFEVRVTNMSKCPPEFRSEENDSLIDSPESLLNNWDEILGGLNTIFESVDFSEYNLSVGLNYLNGKGLKELGMYKTHLAAIAVGGVRNYSRLLMSQLNSNHRRKNIEKELDVLNNPPEELRLALSECKIQKELLYKMNDLRVKQLRFRAG